MRRPPIAQLLVRQRLAEISRRFVSHHRRANLGAIVLVWTKEEANKLES